MIDFRYHVVSIIAVFLALGVGILVGAGVLQGGTVAVLNTQLEAVRNSNRSLRAEVTELRQDLQQSRRLAEQVVPLVLEGRLAGQRFLTVYDGGSSRWRDGVLDVLRTAGAQPAGAITLTEKWRLQEQGAAQHLLQLVRGAVDDFQPEEDLAPAVLALAGRRLFDPQGRALLRRLAAEGFLAVEGGDPGPDWPAPGLLVVAFASAFPKAAAQPSWLSAFVTGTATVTPTLVVSGLPTEYGAVALLRSSGDPPPTLSTFDSGASPALRLGVPLALEAALRRRGGHFGAQADRLVPLPG